MTRSLVVTADDNIWPNAEQLLLLGEWCKRYPKKLLWEGRNIAVLPPYGKDQHQRDTDFRYVATVADKIFADSCDALNRFHGVTFSHRYWRILLGHWHLRFVSLLFNRWTTLQSGLISDSVAKLVVPVDENYVLATSDSESFMFAANDDCWNGILYERILEYCAVGMVEIAHVPVNYGRCFSSSVRTSGHTLSQQDSVMTTLKRKMMMIARGLTSPSEVFVLRSYLPTRQEMKLELSLGQIPKLWATANTPKFYASKIDRSKLALATCATDDLFSVCARVMWSELIPACFIEGYKEIREFALARPWPTRPRVVFSANSFDTDECFKFFAAEKVENGSRLVTAQHGNNIGTSKNYPTEIECRAISDRFVTWGWSDQDPALFPAYCLKEVGKKNNRWNLKGKLLLVDLSIEHRYWPWDTDTDILEHLTDQFEFVSLLTDTCRDELIVRLFHSHEILPFDDLHRWQDRFPDIHYDNGVRDISKLVANSRLVVHSYDSTGILEGLFHNTPLLAFWRGKTGHVRPTAAPFYEMMFEAGIFFDNPNEAAKKVKSIWDDVETWWFSSNVQRARKEFVHEFARHSATPVRDLRRALQFA